MLNQKTKATTALALGLLTLLSGCFGGGGDSNEVPPPAVVQYVPGTEVPVGVETKVDDVVAFSQSQITVTSETREPALLGAVILATSETAEPAGI